MKYSLDDNITKSLPIVKKCWKCWANVDASWQIDGGFEICADNVNSAKNLSLEDFSCYEIVEENEYDRWGTSPIFFTRSVKYTDITANRYPNGDLVLYNGNEMKRLDATYEIRKKERKDRLLKMVDDNPDSLAYIYSSSYGQYWGSNRSGYTSNKIDAGIYPISEAVHIVLGGDLSRYETVLIINTEEEIKKLNKRIKELEISK